MADAPTGQPTQVDPEEFRQWLKEGVVPIALRGEGIKFVLLRGDSQVSAQIIKDQLNRDQGRRVSALIITISLLETQTLLITIIRRVFGEWIPVATGESHVWERKDRPGDTVTIKVVDWRTRPHDIRGAHGDYVYLWTVLDPLAEVWNQLIPMPDWKKPERRKAQEALYSRDNETVLRENAGHRATP